MDKKIGAQFYTLREYMKTIEDFDASCKKVADIGYQTVQISAVSLKAKEMREVLDKYGLKVVTTHRGFDDFKNNLDEVIEYNKILGSDLCGLGMMPLSYCQSTEELSRFLDEANKICEKLKKENMYFGYHNHSFEFIKLGGRTVMDYLIKETDSETFNFIVDTYWLQVGGVSPAKYIKMLKTRAMAIHFKDSKIQLPDWSKPQIADVGEGNLDWDEIISACETAGSRWALVEHDNTKAPFDSLKTSYDYLKTKGFC